MRSAVTKHRGCWVGTDPALPRRQRKMGTDPDRGFTFAVPSPGSTAPRAMKETKKEPRNTRKSRKKERMPGNKNLVHEPLPFRVFSCLSWLKKGSCRSLGAGAGLCQV